MGKVLIVDEREKQWQKSNPKTWAGAREGEPSVRYKVLLSSLSSSAGEGRPAVAAPGEAGAPNVQLAEYEAGHVERPHSHPHDELLYILRGKGTIGERTLEPGIMLFIEKDTVYGPLSTGKEGLAFLRVQLSK